MVLRILFSRDEALKTRRGLLQVRGHLTHIETTLLNIVPASNEHVPVNHLQHCKVAVSCQIRSPHGANSMSDVVGV